VNIAGKQENVVHLSASIIIMEGCPNWGAKISSDDERGCFGCFWYDSDEWRLELNKLIANTEQPKQRKQITNKK